MTHTDLLSVTELQSLLVSQANQNIVVIDTRFQLSDPAWGEIQFQQAHIPGAYYAHLDRDLSAPVIQGKTGRHPAPEPVQLATVFGKLGITPDTLVVAYDQEQSVYAIRLWYLLRYMGHEKVAVLDGGYKAWTAAAGATSATISRACPTVFIGMPQPNMIVQTDEIRSLVQKQTNVESTDNLPLMIDARGASRFAGVEEPLDSKAGHIPGACNYPYALNLDTNGCFLTPEQLRQRFADLQGKSVISYCGSGVTACHNIFAIRRAGLPEPRLYAGSWSEWITDAQHPIATGDHP